MKPFRYLSEFLDSATRFATKVLNRFGEALIQLNAMVESVQKKRLTIFKFGMETRTFLANWDNNCAPHNSRRGSVSFLRGATLDFAISRWTEILFIESTAFRYIQAPYARSLASEKPCRSIEIQFGRTVCRGTEREIKWQSSFCNWSQLHFRFSGNGSSHSSFLSQSV